MLGNLDLVAKNGLRNRRRGALTVGSLAVSLGLLGVLAAAYQALFLDASANPDEALLLVTHHKVSITQPMPVSHEAAIRRLPGVAEVTIWQWFGGTYKDASDPKNFFARFAVEPEKLFAVRAEISLPDAQRAAFRRERASCVVGRALADRFGWKPGDRVSIAGDIFPVTIDLTIAGVFTAPSGDDALYFDHEYLRQLLRDAGAAPRGDEVGVFEVRATSAEVAPSVAAAIDRETESSAAPTRTDSERAWQLSFLSFLGNLRVFLLALTGALAFTILLVSANTISMSVRDRTREIGVLKTLGFTSGQIFGLVVGESALVAAVGGALGLALSAVLCAAVRGSGTAFAALDLALTPEVAAAVMLAAVATGLLGAIVPAWGASRASILDALRAIV